MQKCEDIRNRQIDAESKMTTNTKRFMFFF